MGVITPFGQSLDDLWTGLIAGRSGIRALEGYPGIAASEPVVPIADQPVRIGAAALGFSPEGFIERKTVRYLDRAAQMAVVASRLALTDSGIELRDGGDTDPGIVGVSIGAGMGCIFSTESETETLRASGPKRVSPFAAAAFLPSMPASQVSLILGTQGPTRAISTACATGADNITSGLEMIRSGQAEVVLAGGVDAPLTPLGLSAFASARSLSRQNDDPTHASRPFDRRRDGFVMGEGAGIVVLESLERALARGARIYAEITGYGATSDAFHVTAPKEDGSGLARAIGLALRMSGIGPEAIGYVNAHGTSTVLNDKVETRGIKAGLGEAAYRVPISSTKSMIGHLLGAAGSVELIVTALSLQNGEIHPTANLEEPDPECDLDYVPGIARKRSFEYAISESLAFGGHNTAVVLRKAP